MVRAFVWSGDRRWLRTLLVVALLALATLAGRWWSIVQKPPGRHAVGLQLLDRGRADQAAHLFEDSQWQGVAHYRAGQLLRAAAAFAIDDGITARYNLAGTLARLQRYDEAIEYYESVLAEQSDHQDAAFNLTLVRQAATLRQREREQQRDVEQPRTGIEPGEQSQPPAARDASRDIIQTVQDDSAESDADGSDQRARPQAPDRQMNRPDDGEFDGGDSSHGGDAMQTDARAAGRVQNPRDEIVPQADGVAHGAKAWQRERELQMAETILLRQIRDDAALVLRARLRSIFEQREAHRQ